MGGPTIALLAVEVIGSVIKTESEEAYYEREKENLALQQQETEVATNQQKIKSDENLRHIMGEQAVFVGESGLTPASYQPITLGDMQQFADEQNTLDLNLQFKENAIDSQVSEINQKAEWAPIVNLFGAANGVWNSIALSGGGTKGGKPQGTITPPKVTKDTSLKLTTMPRYSQHFENFNRSLLAGE